MNLKAVGVATLTGRRFRRTRILALSALLLYSLDLISHLLAFRVVPPTKPLDVPFATDCVLQNYGDASATDLDGQSDWLGGSSNASISRENATILILARNSDLEGVLSSIRSLEQQWNSRFHYPIVFLNDEPWNANFMTAVQRVTESELTFEEIPTAMWSWPQNADGSDKVDREEAAQSWKQMEAAGLPYVTQESYHHMCRFFSGFFFDHPALAKYRYYWRVEPDVSFTCRVPYDPFREMRRNEKVYGYTLALWEIGSTCPSLFRTTTAYKEANGIPSSSLWLSTIDPSWAPLPLRWFLLSIPRLSHSRDRYGDAWSFCHFWSNFEIADMEFFRSDDYRSYFAALESAGGFYTERWGDAPVHSLALALFAKPDQVHHFEDIGYSHPPFQHCPPEGVGCQCECDPAVGKVPSTCLDKLRKGLGR